MGRHVLPQPAIPVGIAVPRLRVALVGRCLREILTEHVVDVPAGRSGATRGEVTGSARTRRLARH